MAPETLEQLQAWVEGAETASGRTLARLAAYHDGRDTSVRTGWIRSIVHIGKH